MKKIAIASLLTVFGGIVGADIVGTREIRKRMKVEDDYDKFKEFYDVLVSWLALSQRGIKIDQYLINKGYTSVAIYGMKELGQRLYEELKDSTVKVDYIIDRNNTEIHAKVPVLHPDEVTKEPDVIIVTAIHYFDDIESELKNRVQCDIISLEDVVYGIH